MPILSEPVYPNAATKGCIHAKPGKTRYPICDAIFEIDDRIECVFEDTGNIKLTVNGIICGSC